jgi:hypothetical protein
LTGGDAMSGFWQGYGIGALNFKGEKIKLADGTTVIASCDDAVIIGKRPGVWLSKHLKLSDVIKSGTASKYGINNTPTSGHIKNLEVIGTEVYDKIYEQFNGNIKVSSGYRSKALNNFLIEQGTKASPTSQHLLGQALDIQGTGNVSNTDIFNYVYSTPQKLDHLLS